MGHCHCRFAASNPRHHDDLLRIATDVAAAVELVELAVTWHELEHGDVIPPHEWLDFWSEHPWPHADLAYRLFTVALDVALDAARAATTVRRPARRPISAV